MCIRRNLGRTLAALFMACVLMLAPACENSGNLLAPTAPTAPIHAPRAVAPGQVAHFYVQAFVEDWELLMSDRVPASLSTASEVVFVFTDAGDGGNSMDYVQLRERANVAALDHLIASSDPWACTSVIVTSHSLRRCSKANVVAYYMRLPDGAPSGDGYGGRGSMGNLRDGYQSAISALDGSATYTSWADLAFTVRAIVDNEGAGQSAPYTVVNTNEFDRTLNRGDHPDRLATADMVNAARAGRVWDVNLFIGTPAQNLAVNLTQAQHDLKADVYDQYDAVIGAAGYGHPKYDSDVQALLWRTYSRTAPISHTDVYVQAHEDDWQLFMGDVTNNSLQTAGKVVLVYATAGDANMGSYYWRRRETSAANSVIALVPVGSDWRCGTRALSGHPLWRCERGNIVAYFLRLPDGAQSGEGFAGRGSMVQLRDGIISSLTTMDSATVYVSWADLTGTLGAIVDLETTLGTAPAVTVSAPDYDRTLNPGDHPDHFATGDLVRAAAQQHSWNLRWFVGYDIQNRSVNLSQSLHDIKQTADYAADSTMSAAGLGSTRYEAEYQAWLWRTYMRQATQP